MGSAARVLTTCPSLSLQGMWRYALLACCNAGAAIVLQGGWSYFVAGIISSVKEVALASMTIVFINAGFMISLLKVDPAKALLLISLNPLWAALLGKLVLGDTLPMRTIIAQALSLVSTLVVFVPNILELLQPSENEAASAAGSSPSAPAPGGPPSATSVDAIDLVPLATGFAVATFLTLSRYISLRRPKACLESAPALGAAATALVAIIDVLLIEERPESELVAGLEPIFWLALLGSALGSACYDIALVIAPRSLTSAETALVLLGETIFGPLWVWICYGDMPTAWTLAGGALLLLTLGGHEVASLRAEALAAAEPSPASDKLFSTPAFARSPLAQIRFDEDEARGLHTGLVAAGSVRRVHTDPTSVDILSRGESRDGRLSPLLTADAESGRAQLRYVDKTHPGSRSQ